MGYEMLFNSGWAHQFIKTPGRWHKGPMYDGNRNLERDQFTGLRDKNGKEIYEGDILKWRCTKSGSKKERLYTVMIEIHSWRDKLTIHDNGEKWATGKSYWNAEDREVIGNIYENSELLDKK